MSDNDLIRRGDALSALKNVDTQRCGKCGLSRDNHHVRHPFVTTGFSNPAAAIAAIAAIPAEQPAPVSLELATIAERDMWRERAQKAERVIKTVRQVVADAHPAPVAVDDYGKMAREAIRATTPDQIAKMAKGE